MNLMLTVVLACLLAVEECYAKKFMPHGIRRYGGYSRRADEKSPTCSPCKLPPLDKLQPAIDVMKHLGRLVQNQKDDFKSIFGGTFETIDELKSAIDKSLKDVEEKTNAIVEKLSMALTNFDTCLPLANMFGKLKTNFDSFLEALTTNWVASVNGVDLKSVFVALAAAMAPDIPKYVVLIRDLLINCVNIFLTENCEDMAPIINTILDPDGNVAKTLNKSLNTQGDVGTMVLKNMLGSLLPEGGGGELDYTKIFVQLLCGALDILEPGTDFSVVTGGFCSSAPENSDYSSVIQNIVCGFANIVDLQSFPEEIADICDDDDDE